MHSKVEAIFAVPDAISISSAADRLVAVAVARLSSNTGAVELAAAPSQQQRLLRQRKAASIVTKPALILVAEVAIEVASAHASNEDTDTVVDSDNGADVAGSGR